MRNSWRLQSQRCPEFYILPAEMPPWSHGSKNDLLIPLGSRSSPDNNITKVL